MQNNKKEPRDAVLKHFFKHPITFIKYEFVSSVVILI